MGAFHPCQILSSTYNALLWTFAGIIPAIIPGKIKQYKSWQGLSGQISPEWLKLGLTEQLGLIKKVSFATWNISVPSVLMQSSGIIRVSLIPQGQFGLRIPQEEYQLLLHLVLAALLLLLPPPFQGGLLQLISCPEGMRLFIVQPVQSWVNVHTPAGGC